MAIATSDSVTESIRKAALPFSGEVGNYNQVFAGLDSDKSNSGAVVITVGKTPANHVSYKIDHSVHIWLQQTEAGADTALEIEADDDSNTLLRFRSPMLPEFVDGVVLD